MHSWIQKRKTEWWWRWWWWWFFALHTFCHWHAIRFLGLSTIFFLFSSLTTMIFLFMYRFHCWSLNTLHTIISYSFLAFAIFHYVRFYLSLKTNCHSAFSIGWSVDRSVLHWLKQCQCAYYTPCWNHTLNHTISVKRIDDDVIRNTKMLK